ncbi:hypothetical protein BJ138DRAFT_972908, partial [Hygrophoropsis aurantiaca]
LFQLRTNHVPLNKHLFSIKGTAEEPSSPLCPQCHLNEETVPHYLFACPAFRKQREALRRAIGRKAANLSALLNDPKCMPFLFKFIASTKRFENTFGNV